MADLLINYRYIMHHGNIFLSPSHVFSNIFYVMMGRSFFARIYIHNSFKLYSITLSKNPSMSFAYNLSEKHKLQ